MAGHGLVLRGVRKRWPGATAPVLAGVDLEARRGSLTVIEGRNGAGKTTLMRIVSGMLDADDGEVVVCGRRTSDDRAGCQRDLGVVTAGNSGLYNRLNALQHLQYAARLSFVERERRATAVRRAFDAFGLMDFGGRRADRLSMGQRQRVRLAMAFVHEPDVLLLDEPTTSLDEPAVGLLAGALRHRLAAGGCAVWFGPTGSGAPMEPGRRLRLAAGRLGPA